MENAILKTLSYFDLFDYPLTKEELARFLWQERMQDIGDLDNTLDYLVGSGAIDSKSSFYFLPQRAITIVSRGRALLQSEHKLKRARRAAWLIRSIPFLRAIFVCNSVGALQARDESDIDFFIITTPGRIWLVRFFTNLILRLCGLRTYGDRRANRVCLSFYLDTAHLDFSNWRVADEDVYLAYWLGQLLPLYDPENYYQKLLVANTWVSDLLPNVTSPNDYLFKGGGSWLGKKWKNYWEKFFSNKRGDNAEIKIKSWQWKKLKISLKDAALKDDRAVVIGEGIIKLHENDRRAEYRRKWTEKMTAFVK